MFLFRSGLLTHINYKNSSVKVSVKEFLHKLNFFWLKNDLPAIPLPDNGRHYHFHTSKLAEFWWSPVASTPLTENRTWTFQVRLYSVSKEPSRLFWVTRHVQYVKDILRTEWPPHSNTNSPSKEHNSPTFQVLFYAPTHSSSRELKSKFILKVVFFFFRHPARANWIVEKLSLVCFSSCSFNGPR